MAIVDTLSRDGVAICFFARIRGIPYIFSNLSAGDVPQWVTTGSVDFDGEAYEWSDTLLTDGFDPIVETGGLKEGITNYSGMKFAFSLRGNQTGSASDVWLDLIQTDPVRQKSDGTLSPISSNTLPLSASATSLFVSTLEGFDPNEITDIYMGTETMGLTFTNSLGTVPNETNIFTVSPRGKYGSFAKYHRSSNSQVTSNGEGGTLIADHPLIFEGRNIQLFCALGNVDNETGIFEPLSSDIEDSDNVICLYEGEIISEGMSDDLLSVQFYCQPILNVFDREVATDIPTVSIDHNWIDEPHIYIDDDRKQLSFTLYTSGSVDGLRSRTFNTRLVKADNRTLQSSEEIPKGLYTLNEVQDFLEWTMLYDDKGLFPYVIGGQDDTTRYVSLQLSNEKEISVEIYRDNLLTATDSNDVDTNSVLVIDPTSPDSFWRALGFSEYQEQTNDDGSNQRLQYTSGSAFTADRPMPVFYLPSGFAGGAEPRIYYSRISGPNITGSLGYKNRSGNTYNGYVRINDEIVQLKGDPGTETVQGIELDYFEIERRGQFKTAGFGRGVEHYIEWPTDTTEFGRTKAVQGLAFTNTDSFKILLYLMLGGSGERGSNSTEYDQDFAGGSAFIPAELINTGSFEYVSEVKSTITENKSLFIGEKTKLKDIINAELILTRTTVTANPISPNDSSFDGVSSQYQIKAEEISDVVLGQVLDTTDPTQLRSFFTNVPVVDFSNSTLKTSYDNSKRKLVNSLQINFGYDASRDIFTKQVLPIQVNSAGTYGPKETWKIQTKFYNPTLSEQQLTETLRNDIFSEYAYPYVVLSKEFTNAKFWLLRVGDYIKITDSRLPSISQGNVYAAANRGVTNLYGRILQKKIMLPKTGQSSQQSLGSIVVKIPKSQLFRQGLWSPSLYVEDWNNDGGVAHLTCSANHYVPESSGYRDASFFTSSMAVRFARFGDGSNGTIATITNIEQETATTDIVTINTTSGIAAPFFVEFADYDNANLLDNPQQLFAYISNGTGSLDDSDNTTDRAFGYK